MNKKTIFRIFPHICKMVFFLECFNCMVYRLDKL